MKIRQEYEDVALRCIEKSPELEMLKEYPCSIAYLGSAREKTSRKKLVYAETMKIPNKIKWMSKDREYDFQIVVYEPNCQGMTEEQMEILIFHELMHIGVVPQEDDSVKYVINDHDVQDFRAILDRFGLDWAETEYHQTTL